MQRYAKAIVAVVGAGATALLGIVPPHTQVWNAATVIAAMATAAAVWLVPNQPAQG
jgi:hypothetical protein